MMTCMIYATAGSAEEARALAKTLVQERLVACVNIFDGATSVYRWDNEIQCDGECVMIAKTSIERRVAAIKRLRELHSYDTPCIVSYDMTDGTPAYIDWIMEETGSS